MSSSTYLVAEGVHDVAFIGKLLAVAHGAARIKKLEELDQSLQSWMGSFSWPSQKGRGNKAYHDIERLAVPAPVFYRLPQGDIVVLRNAKGIDEVGKTLTVDLEAFARSKISHRAIGIFLDSDDEPAEKRFQKLKQEFDKLGLSAPSALGAVSSSNPRIGAITLPEPGKPGTLEDLLLTLGNHAYPTLHNAAYDYAASWKKQIETERQGNSAAETKDDEWAELRKPAGLKKAIISAMTALLKPGKSTPASVEDNSWLSEGTIDLPCIQPCLGFLKALLTE